MQVSGLIEIVPVICSLGLVFVSSHSLLCMCVLEGGGWWSCSGKRRDGHSILCLLITFFIHTM